jgi:hypothetical protein
MVVAKEKDDELLPKAVAKQQKNIQDTTERVLG